MVISLEPPKQDDQTINNIQNIETEVVPMDTFYGMKMEDQTHDTHKKKLRFPHRVSCEIYLQQIFHEHVLLRSKDGSIHVGQPANDGLGLLGHFCRSLGHKIFSNKVLAELENLVLSRFLFLKFLFRYQIASKLFRCLPLVFSTT